MSCKLCKKSGKYLARCVRSMAINFLKVLQEVLQMSCKVCKMSCMPCQCFLTTQNNLQMCKILMSCKGGLRVSGMHRMNVLKNVQEVLQSASYTT